MKKLIVTSFALLVAVSISTADEVSSVNVVGYKKVETTANVYKILGINFEKVDSTAFEFTVSDLFPTNGLPDGAMIYLYNGLGYAGEAYYDGYGWDPNTNKIYRGDAFWFLAPANLTNTFLGEVPASEYAATSDIQLSQGYQFFTYPYPVSIPINDTGLGAVAEDGDVIYAFNGVGYVGYAFYDGFGWDPDTLVLELGVGYWYYKSGLGSVVWTEAKPYDYP